MSAVVDIQGLSKRYGDHLAVDEISLQVHAGEVYGFLGPNGAGKTTTLRMALGLIRPSSGRVSVLGAEPGSPDVLRRVGSMIESPTFYPYLSGRDNLLLLARYADAPVASVEQALEQVTLADRAGDKFAKYSLGMKQRLGVAAALLKDPELVILDEPTNGLDPAGMRDMRGLIRDLGADGRTVLLSSHLMSEVQQVCDRVGVISQGRMVAESTVQELRGGRDLVIAATPSDLALARLQSMPEVESVRFSDDLLRVRADERHTAAIAQALVRAGVGVTELRRDERQLEDVFFEMTEHQNDLTKEPSRV